MFFFFFFFFTEAWRLLVDERYKADGMCSMIPLEATDSWRSQGTATATLASTQRNLQRVSASTSSKRYFIFLTLGRLPMCFVKLNSFRFSSVFFHFQSFCGSTVNNSGERHPTGSSKKWQTLLSRALAESLENEQTRTCVHKRTKVKWKVHITS